MSLLYLAINIQYIHLLYSEQRFNYFRFIFSKEENCNGNRNHETELWKNVLKFQSNQNISY